MKQWVLERLAGLGLVIGAVFMVIWDKVLYYDRR